MLLIGQAKKRLAAGSGNMVGLVHIVKGGFRGTVRQKSDWRMAGKKIQTAAVDIFVEEFLFKRDVGNETLANSMRESREVIVLFLKIFF